MSLLWSRKSPPKYGQKETSLGRCVPAGFEHFLILASTITGCGSISAYDSLAGIAIGVTVSAKRLKICAIATGIKKHNSIFKKNKKRMIKRNYQQNIN